MDAIKENDIASAMGRQIIVPEVRPLSKGLVIFGFVFSLTPFFIVLLSVAAFAVFASIDKGQEKADEAVAAQVVDNGEVSEELADRSFSADSGKSVFTAESLNSSAGPPFEGFLVFMLVFGIIILCIIAYIPTVIIYTIVLYKGWKTLQPVRLLSPGYVDMPTAGAAAGLLFVAYFNFYWIFPAYMGLEKYGTYLARLRGEQYTGPTAAFARTYGILLLVSCVFFFLLPITGIILAIMSFKMSMRINHMVEILGKSFVIDRSDDSSSVTPCNP